VARLQDLLGALSQDRVLRGRQFEHLCKWFLTTDPLYASQIRRIWLWNEWPGRWGRDAGIDLVAEARDGTLWAIQAKAYDPSYSIKKSDVDSFLSESARAIFSFRLLVATTNGLGRLAANAIDAQQKPVGCLMLHDLERAAVDWPQHPDELRPGRRPPKTPFPHNREAVETVCHRFTSWNRGQLVMACGTGKTMVGLWVAEQLESERTLVLVPSLSLLAQTMRAWTANAARPFAHLAVCSDQTVAADDDFVEHTSDLGVPVTTDAEAIAAFLGAGDGGRVVFATYQSSPRLAAAFALGAPQVDLAIADEAHRCVGPASGDFATILDGNAIHAARRLFMTATPRFFTDRLRREGAAVDFELASMDDPKQFGPVFHRLGFAKAIEQKLLADYQVAVIGVDDATYRAWARCGQLMTTDGKTITDARTLAGEIGLAKAMRAWGLRRVISFHSRVAAARAFSGSMPQVIAWMPADERPSGRLWAQHVSGEMPSGRRDALLQYFRNLEGDERGLLSNARCLAEGVDVPSVDGVAFIDPRRSQVDIIQAIGRTIRRVEDKRVGTIVVPVFIGSTEDPASALDASTFKPVWEVIKASVRTMRSSVNNLISCAASADESARQGDFPPKSRSTCRSRLARRLPEPSKLAWWSRRPLRGSSCSDYCSASSIVRGTPGCRPATQRAAIGSAAGSTSSASSTPAGSCWPSVPPA
jgi:predicted helicase